MSIAPSRSRNLADLFVQVRPAILTCLVAIVCYYVVRLIDVLGIPPDHIAIYWPATPFLVGVLLVSPRSMWPVLMVSGLGGTALAELKDGWSIGSEMWFTLGNLVDVLIATLGTTYLFKGVPQLTSVKTLAKYFVIPVICAPLFSLLVGASVNVPGGHWQEWRIWFLADALGFLTVTPAILSWAQEGREWAKKPQNYIELEVVMIALVACGYLAFTGSGRWQSPALLYSLVPVLLWATLRLGVKGVSTSMVVVAFLSISGAIHDRGPFTGQGPLNNALSIQLFLFFAAAPFLVFAAIVEEHKRDQQALIDEKSQLTKAQQLARLSQSELTRSNELLRLAMEVGKSVGWDWDVVSGRDFWSGDLQSIFGIPNETHTAQIEDFIRYIHPEDRERVLKAVDDARQNRTVYAAEYRIVRPDGTTRWVVSRGRFEYAPDGQATRMFGLDVDNTDLKQAAEAKQLFEHRFHQFFETLPEYAYMASPEGNILDVNPAACKALGYGREELIGKHLSILYAPESRGKLPGLFDRWKRAGKFGNEEMVVLTKHGDRRIVLLNVGSVFDEKRILLHSTGVQVDITERKLAEEAVSTLSQKLIEAQEHERSRLARELHDDIIQRMAMLAVSVDRMKLGVPSSAAQLGQQMEEASRQIANITNDLQAVSHRLHSPKLKLLGLVAAAESFCQEFSELHHVEIEYRSENVPKELSPDISLSLFRILQEALQNAAKHSGAWRFQVSLTSRANEIELTVHDSGSGFELEEAIKGHGLGLTSIKERIKLVDGELSIDSQLQRGTTIRARVPVHPRMRSVAAGD